MAINTDLKNKYCEQGYYIAHNLITPETISSVLTDIHQIFQLQLARFSDKPIQTIEQTFESLLKQDIQAYLAAARRAAKLASLQRLMGCQEIIDTITELGIDLPTLPTEQVLHINSDRLRIPGGYFGFGAHQDWTAIQGSLDCITIWLPLVPVTDKNFPLQLIPKSHVKGLLPGEITDNYYGVNEHQYSENDFISVKVNPGDVIFMSAWVIHRTGTENCEGFRLSASTRYESATEKEFIDRNYPCAYQRTVHREFITPDFPATETVNKVFKLK